jgi:hypothetical protein
MIAPSARHLPLRSAVLTETGGRFSVDHPCQYFGRSSWRAFSSFSSPALRSAGTDL